MRFTIASQEDAPTGLCGYIACTLNDKLLIDGITLHETADGRFVMSFPAHTDRSGRQHHVVRPINDDAREELEQQILRALTSEDAL